ncbi:hypothetical protein BKA70DRAFT_77399 [Coprinopsis sp. MPI-PUGE-AT-0042]|nr:hypothetical protein BKA70DRAFT_77399 [Coprinopsis sp. MPI-PUGE-AT-0042]
MPPRLQGFVRTYMAVHAATRTPTLDDTLWKLANPESTSTNDEVAVGQTKGASWFKRLNFLHFFVAAAKRKAVANKGPVSVGRRPAAPLSLHALVVGINSYQNLETLNGAAEDARAIGAYLQQDLAAPSGSNDNVTILTDEKATRAAFIEGLNSLANNRAIKADDPIVVYFAGHITDEGDSEVPALLLYDWSTQKAVESISSRELHELLAQIQKRSDNVTVIVDGRPSKQLGQTRGSGTRKPVPGTSSPQAKPKPGDQAIKAPCIIVSCSKGETGREDRGRGRFTAAFLKALRRNGITPTTFRRAVYSISQIVGQNPYCSSVLSTDGTLFGLGTKPGIQARLDVTRSTNNGGELTVPVGSVAGITSGAEFSIYSKPQDISKGVRPAMTCATEEISLFSTRLKPISGGPVASLGKQAFAILTKAGLPHDAVVHVPREDACRGVHEGALTMLRQQHTQPAQQAAYRPLFTEDSSIADIAIQADATTGKLHVNILDERVTVNGHERVAAPLDPSNPESVLRFLTHTAHFYRYLNKSYLNHTIGSKVTVELMQLEESQTDFDENGYACLLPLSDNLFDGGVAQVAIPSDEEEEPNMYGFKVTNGSAVDLYPTVWYFDNSEFSITRYYPREGASSELLKKGQSLTIGYEDGAASPFTYFLPEGQDVDVGFLKIAFTTQPPTELDFVAQGSAFEKAEDESGELKKTSKEVDGVWGSVLHTIVQRRS